MAGFAVALGVATLSASACLGQSACDIKGQDPASASTQSTGKDNGQGFVASLHACIVKNGRIQCQFIAERGRGGSGNYALNQEWIDHTKLVDNLNTEHKAMRAYFLDGHCSQKKNMILGEGDYAWFEVDFEDGDSDIHAAKIIMPRYALDQIFSNVWVELKGKVDS